MGAVKRWQEYAGQYGAAGLVRHLLTRLIQPVWESTSAELLVLEPPAPAITARVPVKIALLTAEEARRHDLSNPEWAKRWDRGDRCYAAWREGQFVHHSWVARGDAYIGEVHGWLRLGNPEAYIYDCFTDGSCRGMGIFPAVLSHIGRELFARGANRLWIAVEHENRSSLKAIERAGFRPAGDVRFRRVGGAVRRRVHHVPGAPVFRFE